MDVITAILPIFIIIAIGWGAKKRGAITPEFLGPANKLVYFLSIPAMIFNSIAKSSFHEQFDGAVFALTLLAVAIVYFIAYGISRIIKMEPVRAGVFILCSSHGNVGYIGLPVAYYYLGEAHLGKVAILTGLLMILHNLFSVFFLQLHDTDDKQLFSVKALAGNLMKNPVIISATAGMAVSILGISIPLLISKCLSILAGLAPPMALLLIGASLSMQLMKVNLLPTLETVSVKLLLLPMIGLILFNLFGLSPDEYIPGLILLCPPTATIAYVLSKEMHGDSDFAVAAISSGTLFSSVTIMIWLAAVSSFVR